MAAAQSPQHRSAPREFWADWPARHRERTGRYGAATWADRGRKIGEHVSSIVPPLVKFRWVPQVIDRAQCIPAARARKTGTLARHECERWLSRWQTPKPVSCWPILRRTTIRSVRRPRSKPGQREKSATKWRAQISRVRRRHAPSSLFADRFWPRKVSRFAQRYAPSK
jgi:hypothetical protein